MLLHNAETKKTFGASVNQTVSRQRPLDHRLRNIMLESAPRMEYNIFLSTLTSIYNTCCDEYPLMQYQPLRLLKVRDLDNLVYNNITVRESIPSVFSDELISMSLVMLTRKTISKCHN